jgi:hypothetical protein
VVVGYSAAGPILPAIGEAVRQPVARYLFVDATMPGADDQCRTELRPPDQAERVRAILSKGGRYPDWGELEVGDDLPDPEDRAAVLAALRPKPAGYHEEQLRVPAGWADTGGAFVLFSPDYEPDAARAGALGWPVRRLGGGHFQLMREPAVVADTIVELAATDR